MKILLVDGKPSAAVPEDAESYFMAAALDPRGDGSHGFEVERVTRDKLGGVDFDDYDLVMLLNVPNFPLKPTKMVGEKIENYPVAAALEKYVADGGGLVIFTGDQLDTDFYNGRLYKKGAGLSPLLIRQPVGDARKRGKFFKIEPTSISATGIMKFFSGSGGALTELIRFFAFNPADDNILVTDDGLGSAVVEARFNDRSRSPAVVSRKFGAGRVVMFYSTAGLGWNDWAMDSVGEVQGLYVLFMAELAEGLSRRQEDVFTKTAGGGISYVLSDEFRDAAVTLIRPREGADLVTLVPEQTEGGLEVRYDRADDVGVYRLVLTRPDLTKEEVFFARNPDGVEGRLAPATEQEIAKVFDGGEFRYIDRSGPGRADLDAAGADKQHWVWMIVAVLVLLAGETYLAMRFGHWK